MASDLKDKAAVIEGRATELMLDAAGTDGYDAETLHCREDMIWRDALVSIAHESTDEGARAMAKAALGTGAAAFPRWCA